MTAVDTFNLFEVFLWAVIGLGFLVAACVHPGRRISTVIAGITFLLFGLSDWVELSTGAWWRPWWLFVWKAACVITLLGLGVSYYRQKESLASGETEMSHEG